MTEYALTTGQHLKAQRIKARRPGATVKYIAISIGATEDQVRRVFKPVRSHASLPRNKTAIKRSRPGLKTSNYTPGDHRRTAGVSEPQSMSVPHDVLADRDRRMALDPRPFGDPAPGYSALDKRQG